MRRNGQKVSLFSYAFPIIVALVLVFLFAKLLFSGSNEWWEVPTASHFLYVRPETTESNVLQQIGSRDPRVIVEDEKLFAGERVIVESGSARIVFPNSTSKLALNKGGKLLYQGMSANREKIILENQKLWIDAQSEDLSLSFPNFELLPTAGSVLSINKNELLTQIYVLKGSVGIQDTNTSSVLEWGEQVSVLKLKTLSEALKWVTTVKDDFVESNWFIQNNGSVALAQGRQTATTATSWDTTLATSGDASTQKTGGILISYPFDETSVGTESITVEGKILNSLISTIRIWWIDGVIDETKDFKIADVSLVSGENNLVYRGYDSEENLVTKWMVTVYKDGKAASSGWAIPTFQVQNFPLEKIGYTIVSPQQNPYSTSEDLVRMDWAVPAGTVEYITINDYRLSKFPAGGANWYYFANTQFGNLKAGVNIYIIRYYDASDIEIHSQVFTIRKVPTGASAE